MPGHKDLRTTQHYAKIVDRKIRDDLQALRTKLDEQQKNVSEKSKN
ncbi:hypothetical protein GILI108418_04635 [Gillisia limnaea]